MTTQEFDPVAAYGRSLGWALCPRTVLVEGTTDENLFKLAAQIESIGTGVNLFADGLTIIAAGERDEGGTRGVCRELIRLQGFARTYLLPNGRPRYRFIGLFDNDKAGIMAVKSLRNIDTSILEYKDVFRLWPVMPCTGNVDPQTLKKTIERLNGDYKGLDWELEDLLPTDFIEAFLVDYPEAVCWTKSIEDKTHRDFTPDGKARFHRYIKDNAIYGDLSAIVELIRSLRFFLNLPPI